MGDICTHKTIQFVCGFFYMCKSNLQMPQKIRLRRMTGPYFLRHLETGQKILPRSLCLGALPLLYLRISGCEILKYRLRRYSLCLGALPLLYPWAASPSVFAYGKYTAPAVALEREYVVDFYANLLMTGQKGNLRVFPGHRRLEAVDSLGFALEVAAFTHNRIFIIAPACRLILDLIVLTGVVADIRTYHILPVLNA